WMPNNEEIVIWSKGKIQKVNTKTNAVSAIPFTTDVAIDIAERVHFETPVDDNEFTVKMIRDAVTSPDEKTIVFRALGYLWTKNLPNGTPKRLTSGTDFEAEPAFSPNGKEIIFVTWNDLTLGAIQKISS